MRRRLSRRSFLQAAGLAIAAPNFVKARGSMEKLNIAMIGSGGRGGANLRSVAGENITALCDVNAKAVHQAAMKYPAATKYSDFRKMFEKPDAFDAVVVSTCEHTHTLATMLALNNKKHVYCEKPLTHNVWEARQVREKAANVKVATQMGIQNHASDNHRNVIEIIRAGVIGPVREAHVWVSRAWGLQSPEAAARNKDIVTISDRPKESQPIPEGLDWDLWLGPAPERPFADVYVPGPKWYRWWDFGNGTMSDLGSHWNDLPFWALNLKAPLTVEASGPPPHAELAPASMKAIYTYGPRDDMPEVKLTWYQGEEKPDLYKEGKIPTWGNGILFVGDKGMLLSDYGKYKLLPEKQFEGFVPPPQTIPRSKGLHAEWIQACKDGKPTTANFEYSGWLTEANHLGNVAYRLGRKLEWNPANLSVHGAPEAQALLRREYRKGWQW